MVDMKILGIDPGLGIVGFGLVEVLPVETDMAAYRCDWGTIKTSKDKPDPARLQEIHEDLTSLIEQCSPDVASVEQIFFFKNAKTLIPVTQARGVILLALQSAGVPIAEYTPMQVKQAMTGYGKADKREIQEMMMSLLKLDKLPRPDDAADALALALCHYHFSGRLHERIGMAAGHS